MKIIHTDKSHLSISSFPETTLLNNCVKDIETKLIENPEIIVYGKKCNQHRSVGFFSNSEIKAAKAAIRISSPSTLD